jgi:hypothetical protein
MCRTIRFASVRSISFLLAFLIGISASWICHRRVEIDDFVSNIFLYYQD